MKKKLTALLLAVVMVVGLLPVLELPASAADGALPDTTWRTWENWTDQQKTTNNEKSWSSLMSISHPYGCADCVWDAKDDEWVCKSGGTTDYHTCLVNFKDRFQVYSNKDSLLTVDCAVFQQTCLARDMGFSAVGIDREKWARFPVVIGNNNNNVNVTYGNVYITSSWHAMLDAKYCNVFWKEPTSLRYVRLGVGSTFTSTADGTAATNLKTNLNNTESFTVSTVAQRDAVLPFVSSFNLAARASGYEGMQISGAFDADTGSFLTDDELMYCWDKDNYGGSRTTLTTPAYFHTLEDTVVAAAGFPSGIQSRSYNFALSTAAKISAPVGDVTGMSIIIYKWSDSSGPIWREDGHTLEYAIDGPPNWNWRYFNIDQRVATNAILSLNFNNFKDLFMKFDDKYVLEYAICETYETYSGRGYGVNLIDGDVVTRVADVQSYVAAVGWLKIDRNDEGFYRLYSATGSTRPARDASAWTEMNIFADHLGSDGKVEYKYIFIKDSDGFPVVVKEFAGLKGVYESATGLTDPDAGGYGFVATDQDEDGNLVVSDTGSKGSINTDDVNFTATTSTPGQGYVQDAKTGLFVPATVDTDADGNDTFTSTVPIALATEDGSLVEVSEGGTVSAGSNDISAPAGAEVTVTKTTDGVTQTVTAKSNGDLTITSSGEGGDAAPSISAAEGAEMSVAVETTKEENGQKVVETSTTTFTATEGTAVDTTGAVSKIDTTQPVKTETKSETKNAQGETTSTTTTSASFRVDPESLTEDGGLTAGNTGSLTAAEGATIEITSVTETNNEDGTVSKTTAEYTATDLEGNGASEVTVKQETTATDGTTITASYTAADPESTNTPTTEVQVTTEKKNDDGSVTSTVYTAAATEDGFDATKPTGEIVITSKADENSAPVTTTIVIPEPAEGEEAATVEVDEKTGEVKITGTVQITTQKGNEEPQTVQVEASEGSSLSSSGDLSLGGGSSVAPATVNEDGTVEVDETAKVELPSGEGAPTVSLDVGNISEVKKDESGNTSLPAGTTVTSGTGENKTETKTTGEATLSENGKMTASSVEYNGVKVAKGASAGIDTTATGGKIAVPANATISAGAIDLTVAASDEVKVDTASGAVSLTNKGTSEEVIPVGTGSVTVPNGGEVTIKANGTVKQGDDYYFAASKTSDPARATVPAGVHGADSLYVASSGLTSAEQKKLGVQGRPVVYDIELLGADGKPLDLKSNSTSMTAYIPFSGKGEKSEYKLYSTTDNKTKTETPIKDIADGYLSFETTHFSTWIVESGVEEYLSTEVKIASPTKDLDTSNGDVIDLGAGDEFTVEVRASVENNGAYTYLGYDKTLVELTDTDLPDGWKVKTSADSNEATLLYEKVDSTRTFDSEYDIATFHFKVREDIKRTDDKIKAYFRLYGAYLYVSGIRDTQATVYNDYVQIIQKKVQGYEVTPNYAVNGVGRVQSNGTTTYGSATMEKKTGATNGVEITYTYFDPVTGQEKTVSTTDSALSTVPYLSTPGTYSVNVLVSKDGYVPLKLAYAFEISELNYGIEVAEYTDTLTLVLVYSDQADGQPLTFTYDGKTMYNVDDAKYTWNNNGTNEWKSGAYYSHVYGYVVKTSTFTAGGVTLASGADENDEAAMAAQTAANLSAIKSWITSKGKVAASSAALAPEYTVYYTSDVDGEANPNVLLTGNAWISDDFFLKALYQATSDDALDANLKLVGGNDATLDSLMKAVLRADIVHGLDNLKSVKRVDDAFDGAALEAAREVVRPQ